jgi:hypothetical protein
VELATSGNEEEKKGKKSIFSLLCARVFSLRERKKREKNIFRPDLPGLRRFRQFVVRFLHFLHQF